MEQAECLLPSCCKGSFNESWLPGRNSAVIRYNFLVAENRNHAAELTGFVLAGGRSSRMGTDKAALLLNGRTLLQRAIEIVGSVTGGPVAILGSRELYGAYGQVIEDLYPGCGPLAGIHAALSHSRTCFNLIIAVDTPFLSPQLLSYMGGRALESGAVVTVPEIGGYTQPLCAVYSREFLPIAEAAIQPQRPQRTTEEENHDLPRGHGNTAPEPPGKSRGYKIVPLFPKEATCVISEAELKRFAFNPEMFENLNTPEDLERARQRRTSGEA